MNTKILTKVLEELNGINPDLSYIRGMVETLLAIDEKPTYAGQINTTIPVTIPITNKPENLDEAGILDARARASLKTIEALSAASKETP